MPHFGDGNDADETVAFIFTQPRRQFQRDGFFVEGGNDVRIQKITHLDGRLWRRTGGSETVCWRKCASNPFAPRRFFGRGINSRLPLPSLSSRASQGPPDSRPNALRHFNGSNAWPLRL